MRKDTKKKISSLRTIIWWAVCYYWSVPGNQLYLALETTKFVFYAVDRLFYKKQTQIILLELSGSEASSVGDFELLDM